MPDSEREAATENSPGPKAFGPVDTLPGAKRTDLSAVVPASAGRRRKGRLK